MRRDITFNSKGLQCVGWLYTPDSLPPDEKAPTVVMAHGLSGVKEQRLDSFAERFAESGLASVIFDYRYLGSSEGEPRGQILWYEQIEDYRNAITWACSQSEVNPDRIGVWGTSFSGGHVLWVAAYDRRVKAVVSQVPGVGGVWDRIREALGDDGLNRFLDVFYRDHAERQQTGTVNSMSIFGQEGELAVFTSQEARDAMMQMEAASWLNRMTIESFEKMLEYDLATALRRISPTPLLAILAEYDSIIPVDMAREFFESAPEPREITILPCYHFDVYATEPWFSKAARAAVDWFQRHL